MNANVWDIVCSGFALASIRIKKCALWNLAAKIVLKQKP